MPIDLHDESNKTKVASLAAVKRSPPPEEDKEAVSLDGVDAISNFSGSFDFLNPDFPCAVACPATISDLGEFENFRFFPSLSISLMYLLKDVESDRLGGNNEPMDDHSCHEFLQAHQADIKSMNSDSSNRVDVESRLPHILEQITRDKYFRHKDLRQRLLDTGERFLVYSDITPPLPGLYDLLTEPDRVYGRNAGGAGENLVGRILMKVREDLRQGHRGQFRWLFHMLPVEKERSKRAKLKVIEAKLVGEDDTETVTTHDIDRLYDIREYFDTNTRVEHQQLFATFPQNEKEADLDPSLIWRRRKRQKMLEEIGGGENSLDEQAAPALVIGIGKLPENEITCLHPSVSRTHVCLVPLVHAKVALIDFASKAGTTVNDTAVPALIPRLLEPKDAIRIGNSQRVFTVRFKVLSSQDLIYLKRQELEKQLAAINASLTPGSSADDRSERNRTIKLEGLTHSVRESDLRDALKAYALRPERIEIKGAYRGAWAIIVFGSPRDAWRARESLNDRGVLGRTVHASWV